jgi:hypothetical protein
MNILSILEKGQQEIGALCRPPVRSGGHAVKATLLFLQVIGEISAAVAA